MTDVDTKIDRQLERLSSYLSIRVHGIDFVYSVALSICKTQKQNEMKNLKTKAKKKKNEEKTEYIDVDESNAQVITKL